MHKQNITMREVARHAGVSSATVSRALSGSRSMSDELRERVIASAEELGYRVNLLGRALRTRTLNVVGLVLPDLSNPFFAALAEELGSTLRSANFDLLISSAGDDPAIERRTVESFLGQQIHALVVIPCDETESATALRAAASRVPTVQFDRRVRGIDVPFVGCDNPAGMAAIATHVRQVTPAGSPIYFVGADLRSSSARERHEAFVSLVPEATVLEGSFAVEWGVQAAREILCRGAEGGTIVAAADVIALGIQGELQAKGKRIPEDFRVIGFDGVGVTSFALPRLTTMRQPVQAMSQVILNAITDPGADDVPEEQLLLPELMIGDSSPLASQQGEI